MYIAQEYKTPILEALEWLYNNHASLHSDSFGICTNITNSLEQQSGVYISGSDLVAQYCNDWEHHSGNNYYPIPGGFEAYWEGSRWEGEQLAYRLDLLQHLYMTISEEA